MSKRVLSLKGQCPAGFADIPVIAAAGYLDQMCIVLQNKKKLHFFFLTTSVQDSKECKSRARLEKTATRHSDNAVTQRIHRSWLPVSKNPAIPALWRVFGGV